MNAFFVRKKILILFIVAIVGVFTWNSYQNRSGGYLFQNYPTVAIEFPNGQTITAYKAISPEEQAQGLSGTTYLNPHDGMLFEFPYENLWNFWMKDMLIPIDIVWISKEMTIVHIEHSLTPETYPNSFGPSANSLYVLEVASGVAQKAKLKVGDKIIFND